MVINEFFPDPKGSDAAEFIELWNDSSRFEDLSGYFIQDKSGKKHNLKGMAGPDSLILLRKSETRISLNNAGETLFLYDPAGRLLDRAGFLGEAPEGGSFARRGGIFSFTSAPTPGETNRFQKIHADDYGLALARAPFVISNSIGAPEFIFLMCAAAALLSLVLLRYVGSYARI